MNATVQGELWSSDPQHWAGDTESRNRPLYERVLQRLDLHPGAKLLDAGCGSGLFAGMAAARGAAVTGLDAGPGLIEYARERAPSALFITGDLERLPFADGAFEAVTAFNSLPYANDPRRAIAELARVTTASGRVVATVGSGPDQTICAGMIDPLASSEQVPDWTVLDLRDADQACAALSAAGLAVIEQFEVAFSARFDDVDDAIRAQMPAGPVVAAARESGRTAVEEALRAFFATRLRPDGTVRMRTVYGCAVARKTRPKEGTSA